MRCKVTLLLIAFLTVLLISFGATRAFCNQDGPIQGGQSLGRQTQDMLTEIAAEAIEVQGRAQVAGEVSNFLAGPNSESYRDFLLTKTSKIAETAENPYAAYEASFTARGVKLAKGGAIVRLLEHGVLTFANPEGDPGVPATHEYEHEHEVMFVAEKGLWKVVEDRIVNLPRPAAPVPSSEGFALPLPTLPFFDRHSKPVVEVKNFYFNNAAAANYALQYWQGYNPSYRYFDGADCTNFVSQAMRAGGWTDVTGWFSQHYSNWWYNSQDWTWSWVKAHYWGLFANNRPRASCVFNVSGLNIGDVLQADWNNDGTIDHSMVVTSKSGSEIYLTYHSNPEKNKPFSRLLYDNPQAVWYGYALWSNPN